MDDRPRRRLCQPAEGRRRRHPGATRQSGTGRQSEVQSPAGRYERRPGGPEHYIIAPTDPSVVYVPSYDPVAVYQPYTGVAPLLTYGAAIGVGALLANN